MKMNKMKGKTYLYFSSAIAQELFCHLILLYQQQEQRVKHSEVRHLTQLELREQKLERTHLLVTFHLMQLLLNNKIFIL